jgi:hypothetical protein
MSYRVDCATKEEWAARCFGAEHRLATAQALIKELEADKSDLMRVVFDLLGRVDGLMAPPDGHLSMHTYGQTPDWFVEAAVLGAYGTLKDTTNE